MLGEMFYVDVDGDKWQYMLVLDPPAALYWHSSSYKLKLSDIHVATQCSAAEKKRLKAMILEDIRAGESHPTNVTSSRGNKHERL